MYNFPILFGITGSLQMSAILTNANGRWIFQFIFITGPIYTGDSEAFNRLFRNEKKFFNLNKCAQKV